MKLPITCSFSISELDLVWAFQELGMRRMPFPGHLSKATGIPGLLAMASTFYGHHLPALAFILMGFDHRVALGKSKILDPQNAGILIRENFPILWLALMLGSDGSVGPLKLAFYSMEC